jgi:hypothetical protein
MLPGTSRQHTYPHDHSCERQRNLVCFTLDPTYSGTMLRRSDRMRSFRAQPEDALLLTRHPPLGDRPWRWQLAPGPK